MKLDPEDIKICTSIAAPQGVSEPVPPSITQTSLFTFPTFEKLIEAFGDENSSQLYSRGRNPTVGVLEDKLAKLERGEDCKVFASGMGAISAAFMGLLSAGDHVLFINQIYGPTLQLADHLTRFGVTFDHLSGTDINAVEAALRPETRLIWMESPGTMTFGELDIRAICTLANERHIMTGIDNTWATPLLQKPLTMGVDIVAHSCSKYIGGHSDVVAGALVSHKELIEQIFYRAFLLNGAAIGPWDAWLILRGLRTLPNRLREHEESALAIIDFLSSHPRVAAVHHPATNPAQKTLNQLAGYTGLLSFTIKDARFREVCRFLNALRIFHIGVSWGGFESLALSPNKGHNEADLVEAGVPAGLVRISVGLEGAQALIDDLTQALEQA
ncbi:trans-sulfuration enzyme family protein [Kordiimonas sp.]|uniref:trans-sulfuration enzyme family protein n=1 Tax=Kordiimonas sp. TaxID=1970157 RepID=UPI003A8C8DD3